MTELPRTATEFQQRRVILLGSTGSIGTNVLHCVEHLRQQCGVDLDVVGIAAGCRASELSEQARQFNVATVALGAEDAATDLTLSNDVNVFLGDDAARQLVDAVAQPGDLVIAAMVGSAGLPAALAAIERGCDLALANKETLVAAGELVMPAVRKAGVQLLPIDSEHSAIFQCLLSGRSLDEVKRLVITASGGPFRTWPADQMRAATVAEALNHPTWNMGPKVTIDSASLMNKALEVIEAHWLFHMPAEQIDVIVHPQSIVHSFVEFVDGSVLAQMGPPDMRLPIQYALTWPHRLDGCARTMNWSELTELNFEQLDHDRFPAVQFALRCIDAGGTSGAILNAANEAAVAAFLDERIRFGRIAELVAATLDGVASNPVTSLDDIPSCRPRSSAVCPTAAFAPTINDRGDCRYQLNLTISRFFIASNEPCLERSPIFSSSSSALAS